MTAQEAFAALRANRDPEAFRELVATYQRLVWSACSRALETKADIEDAVQETFVKLAARVMTIHRNPGSWIYLCAVCTARDLRKAAQARRAREEEWTTMHDPATDEAQPREMRQAVDSCLMELDDDERDLLIQHFLADRTQTALAADLGISQPAVKKRLDRTVETVRQRLRARGVTVAATFLVAFLVQSVATAAVPAELTARLNALAPAPAPPPAAGPKPAADAEPVATPHLSWVYAALAAGVLAAVLLAAGAWYWVRHQPLPDAGSQGRGFAPAAPTAPGASAQIVLQVPGAAEDADAWKIPVAFDRPDPAAAGVNVVFGDGHIEWLAGKFTTSLAVIEQLQTKYAYRPPLYAALQNQARAADRDAGPPRP